MPVQYDTFCDSAIFSEGVPWTSLTYSIQLCYNIYDKFTHSPVCHAVADAVQFMLVTINEIINPEMSFLIPITSLGDPVKSRHNQLQSKEFTKQPSQFKSESQEN